MARTLLFTGGFAELYELAGQTAEVFEDVGMRYEQVFAIFVMSWAQVLSGHYDAGRALLRPNLALAREVGSMREVGYQLYALGQAALADEAYDEAQALLQESVAIFQELGRGDDTGMTIGTLAYAKRGLGQNGRPGSCCARHSQSRSRSGPLSRCWPTCLPARSFCSTREK